MDRNEGPIYMLNLSSHCTHPTEFLGDLSARGKEAVRCGRYSIGWELQVLVLGIQLKRLIMFES